MKSVKKLCKGCDTLKFIWKNYQGDKYCVSCWNKIKPIKELKVTTIPAKALNHFSDKRVKQNLVYNVLRKAHLKEFSRCQAHLSGCTGEATDIHHMKGRIESLLTNQKYWLCVCRSCHHWIENHPKEAKKIGFSLSRLEKQ